MTKRQRKNRKRKKEKIRIEKRRRILFLSLLIITVIGLVFFLGRDLFRRESSPKSKDSRIENILIYPGSIEKVYTRKSNKITINYQTPAGVTSQEVIGFYVENLPQAGWKLISSSSLDAVFEKGEEKLRIWMLYKNSNEKNNGVDYLIDYFFIREKSI